MAEAMKAVVTLWRRIFPRYRRLELRCVTYQEGDRLLKQSAGRPEPEQWKIAKEEDGNTVAYMVWLERRERIL